MIVPTGLKFNFYELMKVSGAPSPATSTPAASSYQTKPLPRSAAGGAEKPVLNPAGANSPSLSSNQKAAKLINKSCQFVN